MTKNIIIAVLSVLVLVFGFLALNYFTYYEKQGEMKAGMHQMPGGMIMNDAAMGMHGAMGGMMAGLSGKTGDALDEAFLREMIVHHEGAVAMAEAVQKNGAHPELKVMAEAIITAQTAEIAQMKEWLSLWYEGGVNQ